MSGLQYLLLMRHGPHRDGRLTLAGKRELLQIAGSLADTISGQNLRIHQTRWVPSGDPRESRLIGSGLTAGRAQSGEGISHEAEATASFVCAALAKRLEKLGRSDLLAIKEVVVLDSGVLPGPYEASDQADRKLGAVVSSITGGSGDWDQSTADLIVGNAPGINWLASRLTRRPIALLRSEIACLKLRTSTGWRLSDWFAGQRWDLRWTMAPTDKETHDELKAKVKSKMDVAKVFGGVVIAVLVFLLRGLLGDDVISGWALAALLSVGSSAILYFATLFAYDSLQMPTRFWGERRPDRKPPHWLVRRPPSSATWVLYQNMIRTWTWLFVPATILLAIGIMMLGFDAFTDPSPPDLAGDRFSFASQPWPTVALIGTIVALILWIRHFRPRFGAQD